DEASRAVRPPEAEFDRFRRARPRPPGEAEREQTRRPAVEVPTLRQASTTTAADRRQIARLLIDRVVLTVAAGDDRVAGRVGAAGEGPGARTPGRGPGRPAGDLVGRGRAGADAGVEGMPTVVGPP